MIQREILPSQIDFLIDVFFQHNTKAIGWKTIALKLINNGTCIVAGEERVWAGGIGNFITMKEETDLVGCVRHTFDLEKFIASEMFKEAMGRHLEKLNAEREVLDNKISQLILLEA